MATISFSGLNAGGFDFGSIVDALISLERRPIDLLEQRKEDLNSRKEMLNEISSKLSALKSAAEALAKPNSLSFVKATSGNTDLFTASGSNSAALGSYQVTVNQLATATRVTSGFATQLGISATAVVNKSLNDPASKLGGGYTAGYITINGTQVDITLDPDNPTNPGQNDSLNEVINNINAAVSGVTASYDSATDKLVLTSSSAITVGSPDDTSNFLQKTGLLASPDVIAGPNHTRTSTHRLGLISTTGLLEDATFGTSLDASGSFTINGVTLTYDSATESLNELITKINTNVSSVVASYDQATDKVVLSSKSTGSLGITRTDVSGNFLEVLGLLDNTSESQAAVTSGQNASITIPGFNDGNPIYSTSNTVTDAIPGVTLTLKQAAPSTPVDLTLTRDSSGLKTKLSDFVTKYNEAVELIRSRLTEEPLDNAISATTRRVGMLRGDSLLSRIRTNLSTAVTDVLSSLPTDFNRMGNLGVSLNSADVSSGGLTFDQTKFDAAIESNFEKAYDVLFADADGDGSVDDGEIGMVPRLLDVLDAVIDTTQQDYHGTSVPLGDIPRRNYTYDQQFASLDLRIDYLEQMLTVREASLRSKFLAAEQAINQISASSASGLRTLGYG